MTNVAIIGATGAIGSEFCRQLAEQATIDKVFAISRSAQAPSSAKVVPMQIDFTDEAELQRAATAASVDSPLDMVITCTGILHDGQINPEKSLRDLSEHNFMHLYQVNTILPAMVMKYFLPKQHRDRRTVYASLSARVGSISDNKLGGWYAYRASKAALNMLIKCASIEQTRLNSDSIVVGLHPGTVDSKLSAPFQSNVSATKLFTPEYSVGQLLAVLAQLTAGDTGKCFAYDGSEILP